MIKSNSKPLLNNDESGTNFAIEMLNGDLTSGINFDSLRKHPEHGYFIIEFVLCDEKQKYVTPYTSHPKKYWHLNSRKFISLWKIAEDLKGQLFLVNYAKKGTKHENEILLIHVQELDQNGIKKEKITRMNRQTFSDWFRRVNKECL